MRRILRLVSTLSLSDGLIKAVPLAEAKTFPNIFANQNVVCKLRDAATIEFLRSTFNIDIEPKPLDVSGL
jgi:hypothetical protein